MRTVTTDNQAELRDWIRWRDPSVSPFYCIGLLNDKEIEAVVGYSNLLEHSCHIHAQAESGDWINREMLYRMFDYPFNVLGKRTLIAPVLASNERVNRLIKHMNFEQCGVVPDATNEGAAVFYVMHKDQCPYLQPKELVSWVA